MTGLHVVRKRRKDGDRWYVYAWRGGPCILEADGERPVIDRDMLDKQYAARQETLGRAEETIDRLIFDYETSPEYTRCAKSTRRDYRMWLTRISQKFGKTPIEVFEDWQMRGDVIAWRNRWQAQPRTADMAIVLLVTLLNWAVENGRLRRHHCHGIETLHAVDKSEEIWEDRHWAAVAAIEDFPPAVMTALRLARLTGLRLGDLACLQWSEVFDAQITVRTRKRGGRAVIPIFPELAALLAEIGRKDTGTVLLNSRGDPWTVSGLQTAWQRHKPQGFDRRLHDLRGTFVTFLAVKGLTDEQIARIIGWTAQKIAEIRARYVDEARVVVEMINRLSA